MLSQKTIGSAFLLRHEDHAVIVKLYRSPQTKEGAEAEMIANFLGETIGTEKKFDKFMSELTGEQKKNFLDYVKEVIDWFKSAFTNSLPAEIRHIEKLYQKALKEAGENAKNGKDTTNKLDSEYGEQFAISEERRPFYNRTDKAFAALSIINRSGNYISDVNFVNGIVEGESYNELYSKAIDDLLNKYSKNIADWSTFADGTRERKLANLFYSDPEGFVKEMYTPPLQSRTSKLYKRLLSYYENDGKEHREPIYIYSEEQYNAFGWVTHGGYVTSGERDQAFSNFADYKERGYKFKETDKGEVVFPVGKKETTVVFIDKNSNMAYPIITKVIKVDSFIQELDENFIQEKFKNESHKSQILSSDTVSYYVQLELFELFTRRNSKTFSRYTKEQNGTDGKTSHSSRTEQQDGGRGSRSGEETGRTSESGAVTEEQSLIPEDSLTPIGDGRSGGSIPERTRKLRQDFIDGKIGYPELVEGEAKLMQEAREKYGVIEEGENPQEKVKVPSCRFPALKFKSPLTKKYCGVVLPYRSILAEKVRCP